MLSSYYTNRKENNNNIMMQIRRMLQYYYATIIIVTNLNEMISVCILLKHIMTTIHMHHDIATDVGRNNYWESTSRSLQIILYTNAKIDEPCNHALCNGCYNKIIPQVVGNANKRIRKQTKNFEELYAWLLYFFSIAESKCIYIYTYIYLYKIVDIIIQ